MKIPRASESILLSLWAAFVFYSTTVPAAFVPFRRSDVANQDILSKVFSEEQGGYSGRMSGPVAGIKCFGDYCDNKQLISVQRGGQTAMQFTNYFTEWFSDEGPQNFGFCPPEQMLVEVQCRGDYCDDMRLHCAKMASGYRVDKGDTRTIGFFSEEQVEGICDDGYYVYGITCRGDFCDDLKLHCARIDVDL